MNTIGWTAGDGSLRNDVEAWTAAVREMLLRPTEASTLQSSVADHTIERVQQRWGTVYDTLR